MENIFVMQAVNFARELSLDNFPESNVVLDDPDPLRHFTTTKRTATNERFVCDSCDESTKIMRNAVVRHGSILSRCLTNREWASLSKRAAIKMIDEAISQKIIDLVDWSSPRSERLYRLATDDAGFMSHFIGSIASGEFCAKDVGLTFRSRDNSWKIITTFGLDQRDAVSRFCTDTFSEPDFSQGVVEESKSSAPESIVKSVKSIESVASSVFFDLSR